MDRKLGGGVPCRPEWEGGVGPTLKPEGDVCLQRGPHRGAAAAAPRGRKGVWPFFAGYRLGDVAGGGEVCWLFLYVLMILFLCIAFTLAPRKELSPVGPFYLLVGHYALQGCRMQNNH